MSKREVKQYFLIPTSKYTDGKISFSKSENDVFQILLSNNDESTKKQEINRVLNVNDGSKDSFDKQHMDDIIELLPKNLRHKAKILLKCIAPHINLTKSDQVIFDNGVIGQNIYDYLVYTLTPPNSIYKPDEPANFELFLTLTHSCTKSIIKQTKAVKRLKNVTKWKVIH